MKNKKMIAVSLVMLLLCIAMTACGHEHTWQDATCIAPKTCTGCNETEGEALGHKWIDATCEKAKTCEVCGITEGEPLAHTWQEATCATPATCSVCGATDGEALPHTLTEANFQSPAICTVCGAEVGEPLAADFETYGIECNVEANVEYDYHTVCWDDHSIETVGTLIVKDYAIVESEDTYDAKDGYEWRMATMSLRFDDENAVNYGMSVCDFHNDYYNVKLSQDTRERIDANGHAAAFKHTINYNGENTDAYLYADILNQGWHDNVYTADIKLAFLVPVGYDGVIIGVRNGALELPDDTYLTDDYTNPDDFLMFRMK